MSTGTLSNPRRHVLLRIAAAVLGGYAFCWGFVALGMAGLFALGMSFHDAEHLCAMLAFLLYVTVFCWAFATRSLAGLTLGGGTRWQNKTWGDISTPSSGTTQHTVKGYWLVDLMARYDFSKQLSASVTVNNAMDKKYYTIFSWYSTYTWGAPRSVNLSMTYRF